MKTKKPSYQLISIVTLVVSVCVLVGVTNGQRRRPTRATAPKPAIDYSKFSHSTKKHQEACNTCHKVPTENWQNVRNYPDIADYPDHDACVSCHRPQFFRGARPVICTVCHVQAAPRGEERISFRNPRTRRQFLIEFPHDKHQDVIARMFQLHPPDQQPIFTRASFQTPATAAKVDPYNNCSICHEPRPSPAGAAWPDAYLPDALTFKNVPTNHASCFNCHWQAQAPMRQNCDGCHKPATTPIVTGTPIERISLKFKHEGGGERKNHVAECTTCHINITKSESLRGLKPDVPITSCTECHNKDGLRLDVSGELTKIDKNREFVCVYCHTSNVGKLNPPASHYLIAERPPKSRKEIP